MKNQAKEIKAFLLENLADHPKDIVAVTARHFSVSRTTVHRHLSRLIRDKKIIKTGATRRTTYFLKSSRDKELVFEIKPGLGEHEVWEDYLKETFLDLPDNVFNICEYGFGEMFNNALEHSEGKTVSIKVNLSWSGDFINIRIFDDGIGIFKKIADAAHFEDEGESILQLSKGKFSTDPEHHTGEGIFFTSRAMDMFVIYSHDLGYIKFKKEEDWFLETRKEKRINGTEIRMQIKRDSNRLLREIFSEYSTSERDGIPSFDKTHIPVKWSKLENESYVSRSQAKRLVIGLEKFKHVILDFNKVATVGQGFVDEVFRVFKLKHPEIKIEYINANQDVRFMIERGLTEPKRQIPHSFNKLESNNN